MITVSVARRRSPGKPKRIWTPNGSDTWECLDLVVWRSGTSSWPWRARQGAATLQVNGRDRWFVNSDAAMAAAEKIGPSRK